MSVTYVGFKPKRSGGAKAQRNQLLYETVGRRYTVEMFAVTNNPADGPYIVLNAADVPKVGQSYNFGVEQDLIATVVDVGVQASESPFIWDLTVEYDTDRVVSAVTDNPLLQPPEISYTTVSEERPLSRDLLGIPVTNSAGQMFDPPFTYNQKYRVVSIKRNEATYDSSVALAYEDACNLFPIGGIGAYCCRLSGWTAQRQVSGGSVFYATEYTLELRRESWALYALDQGFQGWVDMGGRLVFDLFRSPIDQAPLSNPSLLNGRGRKLSDAKTVLTASLGGTLADTSLSIRSADVGLFPPGPSVGKSD
jgi:hypothetical protein